MAVKRGFQRLFPSNTDTFALVEGIIRSIRGALDEGCLTPEALVLLATNVIYDTYGSSPIDLRRHLATCLRHQPEILTACFDPTALV